MKRINSPGDNINVNDENIGGIEYQCQKNQLFTDSVLLDYVESLKNPEFKYECLEFTASALSVDSPKEALEKIESHLKICDPCKRHVALLSDNWQDILEGTNFTLTPSFQRLEKIINNT